MDNDKDDNLDKVFRDGLNGPENKDPFFDENWEAMEELLGHRSKKRRIAVYIYALAIGIAAMLLLTFSWFFIKDQKKSDPVVKLGKPRVISLKIDSSVASVQKKDATGLSQAKKPVGNQVDYSSPANYFSSNLVKDQNGSKVPLGDITSGKDTPLKSAGLLASDPAKSLPDKLDNGGTVNLTIPAPVIVDRPKVQLNKVAVAPKKPGPDTAVFNKKFDFNQLSVVKKADNPNPNKNRYAVSLLTGADLNGAGSFRNSGQGTSSGLQLDYIVGKFVISSGGFYAVKPYQSNLNVYTPDGNTLPANVSANCKVLDIPLNVSYRFYNKGKNLFSAGTGLSSYFMLDEKYQFTYTNNIPTVNVDISNQNRHILSIINLNASYQRKISTALSIALQPYVKLPLTGIGYEHVNLQSAGVSVGLSWNINPFSKAKNNNESYSANTVNLGGR